MSNVRPQQVRNYLQRVNRDGASVGGVIGLIGVVLLSACLYLSYSNFELLVFGHQDNGVVYKDSCYKGSCMATIRFTGKDGRTYEKTTASSNLSEHSSVVKIAFHQKPEQDPENVSINTFGMMWIGPLITGLIGSILSFVGLCLLIQSLPPRRSRAEA